MFLNAVKEIHKLHLGGKKIELEFEFDQPTSVNIHFSCTAEDRYTLYFCVEVTQDKVILNAHSSASDILMISHCKTIVLPYDSIAKATEQIYWAWSETPKGEDWTTKIQKENLKLWLLKPKEGLSNKQNPWFPSHNSMRSCVVEASTEQEARQIADKNAGWENLRKEMIKSPWKDPNFSTCERLLPQGESRLILRDFSEDD